MALRADRVNIPKEIKGVTLSDAQYKDLVEGKAVKVEGMTAKSGKTFDATLQVNAERKGVEFIFDDRQGLKERQQYSLQQGAPHKLCVLELSEKQREALDSGRTLYLKNMVDKAGNKFNAYVRMDKEHNRPRFYKWNPDEKQETGKEKVVAVAEEHKTQVAVNNHGKINEATKNVKEPLKTGQSQPMPSRSKSRTRTSRRSPMDVRCNLKTTQHYDYLYYRREALGSQRHCPHRRGKQQAGRIYGGQRLPRHLGNGTSHRPCHARSLRFFLPIEPKTCPSVPGPFS